MATKKNKGQRRATALVGMAIIAIVIFACNKPFDNKLAKPEPVADTLKSGYKVLLVVMDGVRGEALNNVPNPTLQEMQANGVYTNNGLGDYEQAYTPFTNANAWANLFTGVSQTKNGVTSADFNGNNFSQYPSLFTRLKTLMPDMRTAAFTSSALLKENLLADAATSQTLANDAAVQTATLDELKKPEATVVMAQFSGAQLAGNQYGYSNTTAQYAAAITQLDTYIGALRNTIVARPGFSNEKWLIIISSSGGGVTPAGTDDITAFGDSRRNTYTLFYNPRFSTRNVVKPLSSRNSPFSSTALRLYGNPTASTVGGTNIVVQNKAGETNQNALDPGEGGYTFEAMVKFLPMQTKPTDPYNYNNMPFLAKAEARSGSGTNSGWAFFRIGTQTRFWYRSNGAVSGTRTNVESANLTPQINDSLWHHYAFTMQRSSPTTISAQVYIDGLASSAGALSLNVPAGDGITSTAPMRFGFNDASFSSEFINMKIGAARVWRTALSPDVIYQFSCLPGVPPPTHPNYASLTATWNFFNGSGTDSTFTDATGNGRNAIATARFGGLIQWSRFAQSSSNICPEPDAAYFRNVPNTMDIPLQILRWLGINSVTAPQVDGRAWLSSFDGM